jgi:hypothetical protein
MYSCFEFGVSFFGLKWQLSHGIFYHIRLDYSINPDDSGEEYYKTFSIELKTTFVPIG